MISGSATGVGSNSTEERYVTRVQTKRCTTGLYNTAMNQSIHHFPSDLSYRGQVMKAQQIHPHAVAAYPSLLLILHEVQRRTPPPPVKSAFLLSLPPVMLLLGRPFFLAHSKLKHNKTSPREGARRGRQARTKTTPWPIAKSTTLSTEYPGVTARVIPDVWGECLPSADT